MKTNYLKKYIVISNIVVITPIAVLVRNKIAEKPLSRDSAKEKGGV